MMHGSLAWLPRPGFARDLQAAGWRRSYLLHEAHGGLQVALIYAGALPIDARRQDGPGARAQLQAWCEAQEQADV